MFLSLFLKTLLPFGLPVVMILAVLFLARSRFAQLQAIPLWVYLAAIALILVVWGLVLFLKWRREKADAQAIEAGILASSSAGMADLAPARRAELEQLQQGMAEAIAQLKSGPQGKKALYTIPWYMIIGPPAIGKTTAILNSGLNFPNMTTAKRLRGQGGTRNCDWWFSSDAILLDTAGRYAQSADRSETEGEWFGFLDLLKKHRKKNPLNGLIVGYSFETLIDADDDKLIHDARELRQRIDETMTKIGWTFPVYLLLTKADLIAGFADFFASLSPAERTQVLGASFPVPLPANQNPAALFLAEFDQLVGRLREFRARRLARSSTSEDWGKIFMFPEEFAALRPRLHLFLETFFERNPFSVDQPLFRGAYVSSGKQMGTPLDLVVRRIEGILGGRTESALLEQQAEKEDAYFVRDLFARLLKADQELTQRSRSGASRWFRLQLALSGAALLLAIVASTYVLVSYSRLDRRMNETKRAFEIFERGSNDLAPDVETIGALDELRQRVAGSWRAWPLTVASNVRDAGNELYLDALRGRVLAPIEDDVAESLEFPDELDGDEVRRSLRAELLMLYPSEGGRIGTGADLSGALFDFHIEGAQEEPERKTSFENMCDDFLQAGEPIRGADVRRTALQRGARALRATHTTRDFFDGIVAGASREHPDLDLDLRRMTGTQDILISDDEIRAAFTKDGWSRYVGDRIRDVKGVIEADNALIRLAGEEPAASAPQREDLTALYVESFPEEWAGFLESVRMKSYGGCGDADDDFKELKSRKGSPLFQVLSTLAEQGSFGALSGEVKAVEASVAPIRAFIEGEGEEDAAPVAEYRTHLDDLHDDIVDCKEAKEFEYDSRTVRKASESIEEFLSEFEGDDIPEALEEYLKLPFNRGDALLKEAHAEGEAGELNDKWREKVFDEYASGVQGRYPFGSGGAASASTIAAILQRGGGLDDFRDSLEDGKLEASDAVRSVFRDVDRVRNSLDVTGGELSTTFRVDLLDPITLSGRGAETLRLMDRVTLSINGKTLVGRPANRGETFTWTSGATETRSSLVLEHTGASRILDKIEKRDTIWSWFQLVDEAKVERQGNATILTWEFPTVGIAIPVKITMQSGGECPFLPGSTFRRFSLPETAS